MEPNTNIHHSRQKSSKSRRKCNCKSGKNLPAAPENKGERASIEITVPADIDVELLLHQYDPDLSRTRKKNLTDRIHYFLSRITTTNDNYKLTDDGYHPVCSVIMKNIVDNRHYKTILDILSDPEDPIIESNKSYHTPNPRKQNGECKGYRLTQKYNTGNTKSVILPDNLWDRVQKHSKRKEQQLLFDYTFLTQQFDDHLITISPDVYEYIRDVGIELLAKVADDSEYQTKMIYNLIGRWLYYVKKINQGEIWNQVSSKNHRLNSNITNLPRELRPFLRINGKKMGMIDVSSSQPYILSSVMNVNFFNDTIQGYNLYTIYPSMYEMLVDEGYIKTNVSYSSGNTMNYVSSISGSSARIIYKEEPTHSSPPFMWCHFSIKEIESIHKFQSAPFENDFYMSLLESYTEETGEVLDQPEGIRQKLKDSMMLVLFDDNYYHRKNKYTQMFGAVYPGVDNWINEVHKVIGKSQFAYLLQRCESYLILNVVAREFYDKHPEAPIFSIHDALLSYDEYLPEIAGITLDRFKFIIGTGVGVKDKTSTRDTRLTLVEIDEVWKEIEPIKKKKKFDNVASSVLASNIEAGVKFLHSPVSPR